MFTYFVPRTLPTTIHFQLKKSLFNNTVNALIEYNLLYHFLSSGPNILTHLHIMQNAESKNLGISLKILH